MVKATGSWLLNLKDTRTRNPYVDSEYKDVSGKTAKELIHHVWAHFQMTNRWDKELFKRSLSSPACYEWLVFIPREGSVSYEISTDIANREKVFCREQAKRQEVVEVEREVNFLDVEFGRNEEQHFYGTDLLSQTELIPEVVALYNSATFSLHIQSSKTYEYFYRQYTVIDRHNHFY